MPARLKKSFEASDAKIQGDKLPNLKPDTLLSLTEKIQQNLKKAPSDEKPRNLAVKTSKKQREEIQTSGGVELLVRSTKPPTNSEGRKNGIAELAEKKSAQIPAPQEGRKRLRDGQVKASPNSRSDANKTKLGTKGSKGVKASFNIEAEILALGGTKDDYELIAEALSDSEIEGEDLAQAKASRNDLQKDLARLVKELGVEKAIIQQEEEEEENPTSESEGELTNSDHVAMNHDFPTLIVRNEDKLISPLSKTTSDRPSRLVCFPHEMHLSANITFSIINRLMFT